ncbi:MAG: O-antigen ligase family protein [Methylobacter sp.]
MLLSYWVAKSLTLNDLKIILYLIVFEGVIILLEFSSGVRSFFVDVQFDQYAESDLLYFSRPYGIGTNSSAAASHLFMGILLIEYLNIKKIPYLVMIVIMMCAMVFTFNRTFLLATIVFYAIKFFNSRLSIFKKSIFIFTFCIIVSSIICTYYNDILHQFTRGHNTIDLSGREEIWEFYLKFVKDNIIFGNFMYKDFTGIVQHAHNSYLHVFASGGIVLLFMYLLMILTNINRSNAIYVIPICISGFSQYSIFWGIGFLDIILIYFLLINNRNLKWSRRRGHLEKRAIETKLCEVKN